MAGMLGVMKLRNLTRIKMDRVDPDEIMRKLEQIMEYIRKQNRRTNRHETECKIEN